MKSISYHRYIWQNNKGFFLFSFLFVVFIQILVVQFASSIDAASIVNTILKQIPPQFRAMLGQTFLNRFSVEGAAAFAFNHPLVIALLAINAINIPSKHIAGEIETGTMELLLSHPFRRRQLLFSLWFSAATILFIIVGAAFGGSVLSIHLFHEFKPDLTIKFLKISINLYALFLLVMTYSLLCSTWSREGGQAVKRSAILTLTFYFLSVIGSFWDVIDFLKPYNIFTYFQSQELMSGHGAFGQSLLVLGGLTMVCYLLSHWKFVRRDIPG